MDFFSQIGTQEILMILLVAIIVIGPNKIVEFGKSAGRVTRKIKNLSSEMTSSIEKELLEEKKEEKKKVSSSTELSKKS
ncbi:MAG: twin-arginine translocase TatA/TatE family subunit [Dehalococcoidales bacterium]|nr:twin-arginine translocase TatA/TatE family subunit [Dehalococcoidales bacterium]